MNDPKCFRDKFSEYIKTHPEPDCGFFTDRRASIWMFFRDEHEIFITLNQVTSEQIMAASLTLIS